MIRQGFEYSWLGQGPTLVFDLALFWSFFLFRWPLIGLGRRATRLHSVEPRLAPATHWISTDWMKSLTERAIHCVDRPCQSGSPRLAKPVRMATHLGHPRDCLFLRLGACQTILTGTILIPQICSLVLRSRIIRNFSPIEQPSLRSDSHSGRIFRTKEGGGDEATATRREPRRVGRGRREWRVCTEDRRHRHRLRSGRRHRTGPSRGRRREGLR